MIRFLLDEELVELDDVPADLTVLDWLRLHRRRTGTKEGCASGDCGACTVVVATAADAGSTLAYESINSCITFIGDLHGRQLLTVESLARGDALHPVQQAMVDEHGSQCGFCTPGIVMSLFSLYQQDEPVALLQDRIDRALGGNLCRCTGYRPIRQAASRALLERGDGRSVTSRPADQAADLAAHQAHQAHQAAHQAAIAATLQSIAEDPPEHPGYHQPRSLQELAELVERHPDARLLAGGTDLALEVTQQLKDLPHLISVRAVPELLAVQISATHMTLGAAVTLTRCLELLSSRIPGAEELLLRFGSDQVRNQGTIGGNIGSASPIGDLAPMLIALDSILILQRGGTLRELPLEEYFLAYRKTSLQPGEFIHSVRITLPRDGNLFNVYKVSKRRDDDISSVCAAMHLQMAGGIVESSRLAFGGMAAIPVRALRSESRLDGHALNQASVTAAQKELAEELHPIGDARASAAYRLQVAQNLLQRLLLEVGE